AYRWQMLHKTPHGLRKLHLTLEHQIVGSLGPTPHDFTPRLKHLSLPRSDLDLSARGHLVRNRCRPLPPVGRSAPHRRSVDTVGLLWLDLATDLAIRRVGRHALLPQVPGKFPPPPPQRVFPDVQPPAVEAHRP